MIVVYNETSTPWQVRPINEKIKKIELEKEVNPGTHLKRTVGIVIPAEVPAEEISEVKNCYVPKTIYDQNTNIIFQHKTCNPTVIHKSNYNKDILFLNINIGSMSVVDIKTENTFILSYIIMRNELAIILGVSDKDNKGAEITLYNKDTDAFTTYTFSKEEDHYNLQVLNEQNETPGSPIPPMYKFKKFRPSNPTHLIYAMSRDKQGLEKTVDTNRHIVKYVDDYNSLADEVEGMVTRKYYAATLFVNSPSYRNEDYENLSDYYDMLAVIKENFHIVNILLNTGKTIKQ